ncbi:hypothetical protein PROVALCAL_00736 [Providencia alcalifaciens DSM 30120]|uniref:Uncharacterized protein n=1 Tax=Providencia alcalifaciens DSM 30120 TaxID=520999 RepID=B6XBM5_9GAMM|nr:hypothetical protein PROVALCAL_00736 [Providencia alcalifaciens DSM 30120]
MRLISQNIRPKQPFSNFFIQKIAYIMRKKLLIFSQQLFTSPPIKKSLSR